jgi:hypothetical protein
MAEGQRRGHVAASVRVRPHGRAVVKVQTGTVPTVRLHARGGRLHVNTRAAAALIACLVVILLLPSAAAADTGVSQLDRLRDVAGLPPTSADARLAHDARAHADYTVRSRTVTHVQDPSLPYATAAGAAAASRSNVSLLQSGSAPIGWRAMVDQVHRAPFHGLLHLQPGLVRSGTGYTRKHGYEAVVIDVRGGVDDSLPAARSVIRYPGPGSTTNLRSYAGGETPDPLTPCPGFTAPTGAPLLLAFPRPTTVTDVRITGPSGKPLTVCWYDADRYTNPDPAARDLGRAVLAEHRGVIAMPRQRLLTGSHRVRVEFEDAAPLTWSFTVGSSLRGATTRVDLPPRPDARLVELCPIASLPPTTFADVYREAHAHAIACGASRDLLAGTSASTYSPRRSLSRAQAATLVHRLLASADQAPPVPSGTTFTDVGRDHPHRPAIDALAAADLLSGLTASRFGPAEPITRAQLASLMSRALDLRFGRPPPATSTTTSFSDVSAASTHQVAIEHLAALDIVSGHADGRFRPDASVSREQMATFLLRTAALLAEG